MNITIYKTFFDYFISIELIELTLTANASNFKVTNNFSCNF